MKKAIVLIIFLALILFPSTGDENKKSSASTKVIYKGVLLKLEAVTNKEGIDATLSIDKEYKERMEIEIYPAFTLSGPKAKFSVPTVSTKVKVLSEGNRSIKAIFEFWCNDKRTGWDIVGIFQGKGFCRVGMTRSDSLTGFWKVAAIDTKTGEKIGEVEVWVNKAKPTDFPYYMV